MHTDHCCTYISLRRDGIFWLPAGKDATERLPWLLEYLAVQLSLVLSSGQAGESKANRMGALAGRGAKQVPYRAYRLLVLYVYASVPVLCIRGLLFFGREARVVDGKRRIFRVRDDGNDGEYADCEVW